MANNESHPVEVEQRLQRDALRELIDDLVAQHGPLDTPVDLEAIDRYADLLS